MRVNVDLSEDVLMALFKQAKPLGRSRKRHMEMILEDAVKVECPNVISIKPVNLDNYKGLRMMDKPIMNVGNNDKPIKTDDPAEGTNAFYLKYGVFYHKDLK